MYGALRFHAVVVVVVVILCRFAKIGPIGEGNARRKGLVRNHRRSRRLNGQTEVRNGETVGSGG